MTRMSVMWAKATENLTIAVAWALPRKLVYWVAVRAFAEASCTTCRHKQPDEIGYSDVARCWK